jgi:chromosome partitioning protein
VAKIVTINNVKGGVAKTTTATNLAAGLARKGKIVLLIDSDPQANASSNLYPELKAGRTIKDLFQGMPITEVISPSQYFTNWIRKSSSFIPISKYFSVKCLK